MSSCSRELSAWKHDFAITNTDDHHIWEQQWHPVMGVSTIDFLVDARNRARGASAAISLKPAIQLAAVRTDRPAAGGAISAGSAITDNGLTHFRETLSAASYFWFRRGWHSKLTAGGFGRIETLQAASFRSCGKVFPAREVVIQPNNDTAAVTYIPLTGVFPTVGVDVAKAAVIILDNLNASMDVRLAGRAFNDRMARGSWVNLEAGWSTPGAGDSEVNTGEVSLSGLSLSSYQWMELGFAVRKGSDGYANSRAIFHITPAIKYT